MKRNNKYIDANFLITFYNKKKKKKKKNKKNKNKNKNKK